MPRAHFIFGLRIIFLCLLILGYVSCRNDVEKNKVKNSYVIAAKDSSNLLRFKVKEDIFDKEGFLLKYKEVRMKPLAENEYELNIEFDTLTGKTNAYLENYVIFAMYPRDDEVGMIHQDRKKYKFETYSIKLKSDREGRLFASRTIKTRLNYARAITIAIMSYETKKKSIEIVLANVNLNLIHKAN